MEAANMMLSFLLNTPTLIMVVFWESCFCREMSASHAHQDGISVQKHQGAGPVNIEHIELAVGQLRPWAEMVFTL